MLKNLIEICSRLSWRFGLGGSVVVLIWHLATHNYFNLFVFDTLVLYHGFVLAVGWHGFVLISLHINLCRSLHPKFASASVKFNWSVQNIQF